MRKFLFSIIFCSLSFIMLITTGIFALRSYNNYNNYTNNSVDMINDAVISAREDQKTKNSQIINQAKKGVAVDGYTNPITFAHFQTSEHLASLEFDYPHTWSAFIKNDATPATDEARFDVFFDIDVVQSTASARPHALSLSILDNSYDQILINYRASIDSGNLVAAPYVIPGRTDAGFSGMRFDGIIAEGISGTLIILPLRDKTIILRNEISETADDFENIVLPSLNFIP